MAVKQSLGRGLDALIPVAEMNALDGAGVDTTAEGQVRMVPASQIEPNPFQPRTVFAPAALQELVDSIKVHGVLQPVLLRAAGTGFQLIAGERRWRAAQACGLQSVPAIVRAINDQQALEQALIENVQRLDIGPLDAARAYQRLAQEFGLSQAEIAQRVGKGRVAVANTLRLLELPAEVRQALEDGTISEGHGRAILSAPGEGCRRAVFRAILRGGLSVRRAEQLAREAATADAPRARKPSPDADLQRVEAELQRQLGTRVHVRPRGTGGRIVIDYFTLDDFQRLVGRLGAGE